MSKLYAVGDVHGDLTRLRIVLTNAGILSANQWAAGDATLVFIGDLLNRGPKGFETILFVRRLETEAAEAGGKVICLAGNHEAMVLAMVAHCMGDFAHSDVSKIFDLNKGDIDTVYRLTESPEVLDWLRKRPFMYVEKRVLFQHPDSVEFFKYVLPDGTLEEMNIRALEMLSTGEGAWDVFYEMTGEGYSRRYWDCAISEDDRDANITSHMARFDVDLIVHGHTLHKKSKPKVYYDGKIVNIDGAMSIYYNRNPYRGFVWEHIEDEQTESDPPEAGAEGLDIES